jgi:hypothetical protein
MTGDAPEFDRRENRKKENNGRSDDPDDGDGQDNLCDHKRVLLENSRNRKVLESCVFPGWIGVVATR